MARPYFFFPLLSFFHFVFFFSFFFSFFSFKDKWSGSYKQSVDRTFFFLDDRAPREMAGVSMQTGEKEGKLVYKRETEPRWRDGSDGTFIIRATSYSDVLPFAASSFPPFLLFIQVPGGPPVSRCNVINYTGRWREPAEVLEFRRPFEFSTRALSGYIVLIDCPDSRR